MTTQERFCTSSSSRPIVGSAVATIVWSSAPRNMASMIAEQDERDLGVFEGERAVR